MENNEKVEKTADQVSEKKNRFGKVGDVVRTHVPRIIDSAIGAGIVLGGVVLTKAIVGTVVSGPDATPAE